MAETVRTLFSEISETFWTPKVWLPPNISWDDLKPTEDKNYANFNDIYLPIPFAFVMILIRTIVERFVFQPLAAAHGIKAGVKQKQKGNPLLEKAYLSSKKGKVSHKELQGLSKQLDMSERQIERWLRLRSASDRPSKLVKFLETGWRLTFYSFIFAYGLWSLWNKPWFSEIEYCWIGYPFEHTITSDVWWYYMIELSFYWSLMIQHFQNVRRKDFWEMFIHHIATIALLKFSFVANFTRMGSLILLVHDCADIFLEGAKLTKYMKFKRTCDVLFAIFTVVWLVSRMGYYPFWILRSSCFEAYNFIPFFAAYYIFNGLLLVLLCLHIIWTYFILKILWRVVKGSEMHDSRSSSSDMSESDDDEDVKSKQSNHASPAKRRAGNSTR